MSAGYIIGVTEKGKPKKKRARPAKLKVDLDENDAKKSAKKTKTNVSPPFGSFEITFPIVKQINEVYFRCDYIKDLNPTHLFDKTQFLDKCIFLHQLYNWGKGTTALDDVIMGSPVLFGGCETYVYQNIEEFFSGNFIPYSNQIASFKWIIIELFATYLSQFALADGRIIWVDEKNSVYLNNSISLSRSIFGKGREKLRVKINWVFKSFLMVMPELD